MANEEHVIEKEQALEQTLDACQKESKEWQEKFIRASADLENFQKRIVKERAIWAEQAQTEIFTSMLDIIDDFDRALSHTPENSSKEVDAMRQGFEMIYSAFYKMLDQYGIKEMSEVNVFDPEEHEAMVQVDSAEHESGAVVEIMQKGFKYKDKVLRPAKVSVAK